MVFALTKVILWLILPPASLLVMLLAGLFVLRKHPASGKALVAAAVLLLYLLSLPMAADMLMRPLESSVPPFGGNPDKAEAIVVLGGGVLDLSWAAVPPGLTEATLARVVAGVELARKLKLPVVMSGGSGAIDGSTLREADAMADQAIRLGLDRKYVLAESRSRNTLENARGVRELIGQKQVLLVTSASHMKRASGMFTRQGFTVIPVPTDYRTQTRTPSWTNLFPRAGNLDLSSNAIAEHVSLTWYRLRGAL
ncbi:MAG: YdcF family protein [Nitrospirota bacterium]|nr:YdcF family protein [Nitrospirota bacterium]